MRGPSFMMAPLIVLLMSANANSEVLISEIMYNPRADNEADLEWVELYNSGATAVDLSRWTIEDVQDGEVSLPFPSGLLLNPNEAIVLTGNRAAFDANWQPSRVRRLQVENFPTWSNSPSLSNETVGLRDQAGVIRDQVNFDDQGDWPRDDGSYGSSIFLKPEALSSTLNDYGSNWLPGMPGVYGSFFADGGELGENHGSPGIVATIQQDHFAPSADAMWSMAILPDTQNYAKSSINNSVLTEMTEWLRDNRDIWKIQFVVQEGDIVNNNDTNNPTSGDQTSTQQWQNVKQSFSVLDGELPYILATGNHDHGTTNAQNRNTHLNDYFSASDNSLVDPLRNGILQGTMEPGRLENAYYEIQAPDGRKLLVVSLEWGPRQIAVDWANRVVEQAKYEDHTAILLTHSYTNNDDTRTTTTNTGGVAGHAGEDLWHELVETNDNFEFVFSGHIGGDGLGYVGNSGEDGGLIHQLLFNTQFEANGGNGWIRVMEFLDDGRSVRMRTISPLHGLERTTAENNRVLQISSVSELTADFNQDGDVDNLDLMVWESAFGTSSLADSDGDGDSDGADFLSWQRELKSPAVPSSMPNSVPESCAVTGAAIGFICELAFASRLHRNRLVLFKH